MSDDRRDEEVQRDAEHRAAALHNLGWEVGAGASVWARAASDELDRHTEARARFASGADRADWERLHGSALMVIVAVDQVLAFEHRVRKLTGDAELQKARRAFDAQVPHAEAMRDLVAHLDEYAVGLGQRQSGKRQPTIAEQYVSVLLYWTESGDTYVNFGNERMNLRAAVEAAAALAEVVERVRLLYRDRAGQDANEAFRRRFALPPGSQGS